LFVIALLAYLVLWIVLLARLARCPGAVFAEFQGANCDTIVRRVLSMLDRGDALPLLSD